MKKIIVMSVIAVTLVFTSCTTVKDLGSYGNPAEDEAVVLNIDSSLTIKKFGTRRVTWGSGNTRSFSNMVITVPAGIYDMEASYYDVAGTTVLTADRVRGSFYFEAGKTYRIVAIGSYNSVALGAYDTEGKYAEIPLVLKYIPKVDIEELENLLINIPLNNPEKSVVLDNEEYSIRLKQDQDFILADKKNGKEMSGKYVLYVNYSEKTAKLYLQECEEGLFTAEEYIKSDYKMYADFIFIPKELSDSRISFVYEKPFNLLGSELSFSISVEE